MNDIFTLYETEKRIYKIYDCCGMFKPKKISDDHRKLVYIKDTSICLGSYENLEHAIVGIKKYEEES